MLGTLQFSLSGINEVIRYQNLLQTTVKTGGQSIFTLNGLLFFRYTFSFIICITSVVYWRKVNRNKLTYRSLSLLPNHMKRQLSP